MTNPAETDVTTPTAGEIGGEANQDIEAGRVHTHGYIDEMIGGLRQPRCPKCMAEISSYPFGSYYECDSYIGASGELRQSSGALF